MRKVISEEDISASRFFIQSKLRTCVPGKRSAFILLKRAPALTFASYNMRVEGIRGANLSMPM